MDPICANAQIYLWTIQADPTEKLQTPLLKHRQNQDRKVWVLGFQEMPSSLCKNNIKDKQHKQHKDL